MNNSAEKENITILLPTLNEEEAIGEVIDELKTEGYENILVIDGHSNDKTIEIAKTKNVTVQYQKGSGKSDAIKSAIEFVKTPYLLVMDCDYTYDPRDIQKFLEKIDGVDEIIGVRNLKIEGCSKINQLGNSMITRAFNLAMGSKLNDVCSGMYLFRLDFLKKINFQSKGFQIELELAAKTGEYGKISEVPINYRTRLGKPQMSRVQEIPKVFNNLLRFTKIYNPILLFTIFAGFLIVPALVILGWIGIMWLFDPESFRPGVVQITIILLIIGSNGLAFALISSHMRRIERKINSILWRRGWDPEGD